MILNKQTFARLHQESLRMERRIERIGLAQLATLSDAQKATLVQRLQTLAHVADRLAADAQRAREDQ